MATRARARRCSDVVVGGPLCESGDIFTQEEGGFVCTRACRPRRSATSWSSKCAGAYGFVMGSNYNSKPLAAEVLIARGKPHLIRARQTFDDLIRGESIPVALASASARTRDEAGSLGIDMTLLRERARRTLERTDFAGLGRRVEGKVRDSYVADARRDDRGHRPRHRLRPSCSARSR